MWKSIGKWLLREVIKDVVAEIGDKGIKIGK